MHSPYGNGEKLHHTSSDNPHQTMGPLKENVMPRSMVGHPNLILETLPEECEKRGWQIAHQPKHLYGKNEWDNIFVRVAGPKFHASLQLQQMPGCCAVLIASYIDPEPRTQETFRTVIEAVRDAAYEAGFGSLLLSQVTWADVPIRKALWGGCLDMGFEMSKPFVNAKSGNKVVYLTKDLGQRGKVAGLEVQVV